MSRQIVSASGLIVGAALVAAWLLLRKPKQAAQNAPGYGVGVWAPDADKYLPGGAAAWFEYKPFKVAP